MNSQYKDNTFVIQQGCLSLFFATNIYFFKMTIILFFGFYCKLLCFAYMHIFIHAGFNVVIGNYNIFFDSKMEQISSSNPTTNSRPHRTVFNPPQAFQTEAGTIFVTHIPSLNRTEAEMQMLIEYLSLLRQQLPTMQYSYLFGTLFSTHHESLILTHQHTTCAGLTFCELYDRKMMELTLIASKEQRKGFGSILVNYLKSLSQLRRNSIIVTHADNAAIGFYEKMGFSVRQLAKLRNQGDRIFTNSTVMYTKIDSKIDYFALRGFLRMQREWVAGEMRRRQPSFEATVQKWPIQYGANFFCINPKELQIEDFDEQLEQLVSNKNHKRYRQFIVHLNRVMKIAHPQVVKMRQELKNLQFLDYAHPFELYAVRENAVNGKYQTKQQMVEELQKLIRNCNRLYASQESIIANLKEVSSEVQLIKQYM